MAKARRVPGREEARGFSPDAEAALIRLVEALAEKAALRDHRAATNVREAGKA